MGGHSCDECAVWPYVDKTRTAPVQPTKPVHDSSSRYLLHVTTQRSLDRDLPSSRAGYSGVLSSLHLKPCRSE